MLIIKHNGGWSASNDARIETKKIPVVVDGKTKGFDKKIECIFNNAFTVSGMLNGDVKIAIKDDVTEEVSCFVGNVISPSRISVKDRCSDEWLKEL